MPETKFLWHPSVHRRVRERLYYFLVGIDRYFETDFQKWFEEELANKIGLGSYCLYELYGEFDILIRVWINPSSINEFNNLMKEKVKGMFQLEVDEQILNWCFPQKSLEIDIKASEYVTKESILAVQEGDENERAKFLKEGLFTEVTTFPTKNSIKFYIAIQPPKIREKDAIEHLINNIKDIFSKNKNVQNKSLYRGAGFSWLLAKATTKNVFNIRGLVENIAKSIAPFGSYTTTYIVATNNPIEVDKIDVGSLRALDAWDPAVDAWLPALYTELPPASELKIEMENFLRNYIVNLEIPKEDEVSLKNFFKAVVEKDKAWAVAFSMLLFSQIEELLRQNLGKFISGSYGDKKVSSKLKEFGFGKKIKELALREVIELYSKIVNERFPKMADSLLPKNHTKIEETRNGIAHGWKNPLIYWKDVGEVLFELVTKSRKLIRLNNYEISKKTRKVKK